MDIYLNCKQDEALNGFGFTAVTEETVKSVMNSIKLNAVASDQIPIYMMKNVNFFAIELILY